MQKRKQILPNVGQVGLGAILGDLVAYFFVDSIAAGIKGRLWLGSIAKPASAISG